MEAADAGLRLVCIITDGIPAQDMMRVKRYLMRYPKDKRTMLVGPELRGHHQRRQGDARHHAAGISICAATWASSRARERSATKPRRR